MAKKLGGKVEARTTTIGVVDDDEDCSVGDVVAIASGDATPYDGDSHDADGELGVRARGAATGGSYGSTQSVAPVTVHGAIVASVDSGLTAGTAVGGGNATNGTVGVFESGGSRGVLLCDEGGTYKGADIPAGAAVVDLK